MLVDMDTQIAYIPVSLQFLHELRDWSEPMRVRFEHGELIFKKLGQPVKGVNITSDELTANAV